MNDEKIIEEKLIKSSVHCKAGRIRPKITGQKRKFPKARADSTANTLYCTRCTSTAPYDPLFQLSAYKRELFSAADGANAHKQAEGEKNAALNAMFEAFSRAQTITVHSVVVFIQRRIWLFGRRILNIAKSVKFTQNIRRRLPFRKWFKCTRRTKILSGGGLALA